MLEFFKTEAAAVFTDAAGEAVNRLQEVRIDPVTRRQCRITPSRASERERGTEKLYRPPDDDLDESRCPFCPGNLETLTPCLSPRLGAAKRLVCNRSVLFPNLFPYTEWSAVSLFGGRHHVEIGMADTAAYRDSLCNCSDYLGRVVAADPAAQYLFITQNHLPAAGGSLAHPHLQVHATALMSTNHRLLHERAAAHREQLGTCIFADLLRLERQAGERYIGSTGRWEWLAAFAPSGFYEIWGITSEPASLLDAGDTRLWGDLAAGILNTQRLYRSLNRNAYNLSLLGMSGSQSAASLKVGMTARSSYAPWVRSDFTGFEIASGEMATFTYPETVAAMARPFWR